MENTAFVAELFQAANKIDKIPLEERRRLLEQAVATIVALRERAGGIDSRLTDVSELAREIRILISAVHTIDTHRLVRTFLTCAEVIRSLHVFVASHGQ